MEQTTYLREAYILAEQMIAKAPNIDALCLAVGLLIGARHNILSMEEWREWGLLASKLMWALAHTIPSTITASTPQNAGG